MPDGTHSILGASSAERWINCPGSVALIQAVGNDEESEYAAEGTLAHSLAAHCLNNGLDCWEALADFPDATAEMSEAVQTYLDYARPVMKARCLVEHHVAHPAFHKAMFGTLDFAKVSGEIEFIDYKHGVGVAVDAEENVQLRYYAFALMCGETWPSDLPRIEDMTRVKLTIVQPRGYHPDGAIRSWELTAGEIKNWAYNTLREAMQKAGEKTFKLGEHCRFCPAKLVCPSMRHLATDAALAQIDIEVADRSGDAKLPNMDDEWLGQWYGRIPQLEMFIKAIKGETSTRMLAGKTIINAKLVFGKVDREWKPEAEAALVERFGDQAWKPRALVSPAGLEELLGKKGAASFIAEYVQKPSANLTVAPLSDKRPAQKLQTNKEVFAGVDMAAYAT